jgi:hypothetical protein
LKGSEFKLLNEIGMISMKIALFRDLKAENFPHVDGDKGESFSERGFGNEVVYSVRRNSVSEHYIKIVLNAYIIFKCFIYYIYLYL